MSSTLDRERVLTELDHARLSKLDQARLPSELQASLEYADIVPQPTVPADVVTMYSQVVTLDHASGARQQLTLCYPKDADPQRGFVSVLSPVGASLLGLRVGAVACWQPPHGEERCATVEAILFQPEANGDYTT